ncbi:LysM peptidoglycan-binding domain-containing protein [Anaerosporobacter faecicola]|uniref:LysM peptidoglycan-binding domain-containing protein n=1 Tax=Anaerosporobacter faecicola TaxID=2718714 RepID=UPI00143A204C|nr:LysM domain-containing protein [Anaerosporobacter faecicola]
MIQSIYSSEEMDAKEEKGSSAFKMPKNIRQIGQVDMSKKIYAEDYVMTYIKQLAEKATTGERKAVLLGQYIKSEGSRHIFINGAVEIIESSDSGNDTMFSNEVWSEIYDCIKKYFSNVEIVGWYITKKDGPFDLDEHITKMHLDNFSGQDKTLLVYDANEKEEAFYFYDKGKLKRQSGYYIYYDRNEEMQNYMVENKDHTSTDEGYEDLATQRIRKLIEAKAETNKDKSMMPLVYTASSLLAVVVLVIGATMVSNYDKMKDTEDAVAVLSDAATNIQEDEKAEEVTAESSKITQVETVPSTIGETDGSQEMQNINSDNADVQAMIEENEAAKSKEDTETDSDDDEDQEDQEDQKEENDTQKEDSEEETTKSDTKKESGDTKKETTTKTKETMASTKKYTVKKGETLVSISTKMYGTIKGVEAIRDANNIEDEDLIYEGQEIIIPAYK